MGHTVNWTTERRQFRAVTEPTNLIAWATDTSGQCFYLSPEWFNFTGARNEQGLGLTWISLVHPDDMVKVRQEFRRAHESRTAFGIPFRLARAEGDYSSVWGVGLPKFSDIGHFEGFYGAVCLVEEQNAESDRNADDQAETKRLVTEREREILHLISYGNTSETVASMLGITTRTVDTHIGNACAKLGAFNRVHAVAIALRQDLL